MIQMLNARHPRVLLDIAGIRDVEKLLAIGADEIPDIAFDVLPTRFLCAYPVGRVVRRILLIKRLAVNPVWKTLEDQRTVQQVRNQVGRYLVVVLNEIAFGVAVFGPENFV